MKPKILLVNPPIYDFTAYDFWMKPYGLMQAGGRLRSVGELSLFDYLDRLHPDFDRSGKIRTDSWGRGAYPATRIDKPACYKTIRRYYRRFGIGREIFQQYLAERGAFDVVLIGTVMTYWYPGVREVIEDVRRFCPDAKIVLGGFYATACRAHAQSLGADVVLGGDDFDALDERLGADICRDYQLPAWELYDRLNVGIMKLTRGCPFACSYCYVPQSGAKFSVRPLDHCLAELHQLIDLGVENIAFYDDALLFRPELVFIPFLKNIIEQGITVNFHTPNALHARFVTEDIARLMVQAGFKTFYLGFESHSEAFHEETGSGKVVSHELAQAVHYLTSAGAAPNEIVAYEILGHPRADLQQLEESMRFVNGLGIRIMLSDFSPVPGTPDGNLCAELLDLSEPLNHNKAVYPVLALGTEKIDFYKELCRKLNKNQLKKHFRGIN